MTRELRLRILSSLVLVPAALGAVWMGGIVYFLALFLLFQGATAEWISLVLKDIQRQPAWRSAAAVMILVFAIFLCLALGGAFLAVGKGYLPADRLDGLALRLILIEIICAALIVFFLARLDWRRGVALAAAIPYLGGSLLALAWLRSQVGHRTDIFMDCAEPGTCGGVVGSGSDLIIYLCCVVWGTDTGAYIAGRSIGGPKIAPTISPSKTWSGLGGGMLTAALAGFGVASATGAAAPYALAVLGAVLAVIAQAGDFFESWVKRKAGVKDSGRLIPGHGGILDRIDGLIFAAIGLAFVQASWGQTLW